ncbi:hypothetical protein Amsp01_038820 [Amycolatopsis sp. NBRC 101858]|uniref:hypothetical protein n=1 Tax=Amycolatopsis sp. NBRC 101858 TaxID=3032200 RepID=UPI0024A44778|nr:hypothetical protein [Amycolatopsis sp. NBRC 101858]GLY37858.1 hypothetical protein Amsp01_038820 [Amycolatopsis sp. NBRC 101858]
MCLGNELRRAGDAAGAERAARASAEADPVAGMVVLGNLLTNHDRDEARYWQDRAPGEAMGGAAPAAR